MKKIICLFALLILGSCGSSKSVTGEPKEKTLKGEWQITSVKFQGEQGTYKAKMFGGFHRVLAPNQEWSVPIWLVTHVDLHRTAKVQAMLRCIKSARQEE